MAPEKSPSPEPAPHKTMGDFLAEMAEVDAEHNKKATGHKVNEVIINGERQDSAPEIHNDKKASEVIGKAKTRPNLKEVFKNPIAKVSAVLLAGGIIVGGTALGRSIMGVDNQDKWNQTPQSDPQATEYTTDDIDEKEDLGQIESLTGYPEFDSRIDGSFTQYDNPGCYNDREGKFSPTSVANTEKALALIGENIETATPEEMAAAFEYVAFSQKETAAFVATAHGMPGFENLTYEEAAQKIGNMSAEEKNAFQDQLKDLFGHATFHFGETNGQSWNFYMDTDEDGNMRGFVDVINVEGVKTLVMEVTREDGSKTIANIMVRCFNGNQVVVVVEVDGQSYEIIIPVKDPTPDNPTPDNPTPDTPTPDNPTPKDKENMERIDDQIFDDISYDIGTEDVVVTPTPEVKQEDITVQPSANAYEGTAPATFNENQNAAPATPVQDQVTAPENDYSQNQGGANSDQYAPVQENNASQEAANEAETPIDEELDDMLDDILAELGIN